HGFLCVAGNNLAHEGTDHLQVGDVDVTAGDLLDDHAAGQGAFPTATEFSGQLRGEQATRAHLLPEFRVDDAVDLTLLVIRGDLLTEGAGLVDVAVHLCVDGEIHDAYFPTLEAKSGWRFSAKAAAPSMPSAVAP